MFAIVLLNYNGLSLLQNFLPKIIMHSKNANIYIADNNSTDKSKEWVKEYFPQVNWIQLDKNYGYAKGYNLALKKVSEPFFCLMNTDIETTENWLNPIQELFQNNPNIGIIQPKILDYKNKNLFEYAGAAGGFIDQLGFPYCRGRVFSTVEQDNNQYQTEKIFWASGACFCIRKSVFYDLDGFDDDFFAHQEEIDLCWRAFNAGIETYCCTESTVYHIGGATLNKSSAQKTYLNFRNSLYMLYKNLPTKSRFSIIFKRLCYDGIAGIQMILQGKPKHCFAVIKSHFAYYLQIPKLKKKRNSSKYRTDYFHTKNIVKSYFIKKNKFFSQ